MIYALAAIAAIFCAFIQWGDEITVPCKDFNKKEAKYILNIKKQDEKETYQRAVLNRKPSGYMTVEEYELLSAPKDKMKEEIEIPTIPTPSDMIYVPKPTYKIVKYNMPPGGHELSISKQLYVNRQLNLQGIVSPDFKMLVYPTIYYYPNSGSTACDVFVINLDEAKSNLNKILTANVIHRISEPILSTDKDNNNYYTFRTLTPVDFSSDSSKILIKEKVGNTKDGVWKTTPYVYDFKTKNSYNLEDIRSSIKYYWQGAKSINLDDKRWDIKPLGFSKQNPDWVVVMAEAYTGDVPVNLGTWAISAHGESPRLVSLNNDAEISSNGFKLIKNGVEQPSITKLEEKQLKIIDKADKKQSKQKDKAEIKELKSSYKERIKNLNNEYKESQKDYKLRQKINSTTSENEALEKYKEIRIKQELIKQQKIEKQKQKELKKIQKNDENQNL